MGLFSNFYDSFIERVASKTATHVRASLENPNTPLSAFDVDEKTTARISVNENNSLSVGAVFACVKVIAETIALMDLEVFKKNGKTKQVEYTHSVYPLLSRDP